MLAHALDSLLHALPRWDAAQWPVGARLAQFGNAQVRVLERGTRGPTCVDLALRRLKA